MMQAALADSPQDWGAEGGQARVMQAAFARARSRVYDFLAAAFAPPQTDLGALAAEALGAALAAGLTCWESLATCLAHMPHIGADETWRELNLAHTCLFVGPGRPLVPPYESVYRDPQGLTMGPWALDVRRLYIEEGLVFSPDTRDLPDHVAAELEFMAHLAWQEAEAWDRDDTATVQVYLDKERGFLTKHLGVWFPLLCDRLTSVAEHPFYVHLATLARGYVLAELRQGSAEQGREGAGDAETWNGKIAVLRS